VSGASRRTLAGLPLSARDRRALDETLTDWTFEREAAPAARRWFVDLRWAFAVTLVLGRIGLGAMWQPRTWMPVLWAVLLAAAASGVMSWHLFRRTAERLSADGLPESTVVLLALSLLPSSFGILFGPMLAIVGAGRRPQSAVLGPMFAALVVAVLLLGWITPESNQWFRQRISDATATRAEPPSRSRLMMHRGIGEWRVQELVANAFSTDAAFAKAARDQLGARSGLLAWMAACWWLGVSASGWRGHRRWLNWRVVAAAIAPWLLLWQAGRIVGVLDWRFPFQPWAAALLTVLVAAGFGLAKRRLRR
jgi:hypothetical protein